MESQPQNPILRNNPEKFHPCIIHKHDLNMCFEYSFEYPLHMFLVEK